MNNKIFEDLFVLEMASNHQGSVERGLQIISAFSKVVRFNNVRAAIKLQFRDIDNFVHKDFVGRDDIRYVKRLADTKMSKQDFGILVNAIRKSGCIPMSTPFDEKSVDWCVEFDMPIIKVASADNNDWTLLEKIATTKKPVIISTGGMTQKDMDDLRFGLSLGVDWVAVSYVRRAEDLDPLREIIREAGLNVPLIAKIEMAEAVENNKV